MIPYNTHSPSPLPHTHKSLVAKDDNFVREITAPPTSAVMIADQLYHRVLTFASNTASEPHPQAMAWG